MGMQSDYLGFKDVVSVFADVAFWPKCAVVECPRSGCNRVQSGRRMRSTAVALQYRTVSFAQLRETVDLILLRGKGGDEAG